MVIRTQSARWSVSIIAASTAAIVIVFAYAYREVLFASMEPFGKIAGQLSRTEARRREAPEGSTVALNFETIATLRTIGGVRYRTDQVDSFFVFGGEFLKPAMASKLSEAGQLIGVIASVTNWESPLRIELMPADQVPKGALRIGRLSREAPHREFQVFSEPSRCRADSAVRDSHR